MTQGHGSRWTDFGNNTAQRVVGTEDPVNSTELLFKLMATSSGGKDLAVAGSSGAEIVFLMQPATGEIYHVRRINMHIDDTTITPSKFGGQAVLTNGVIVDVWNQASSAQLIDFTDGVPITHNAEFAELAGTDLPLISLASTDDMMLVRWTIGKSGANLRLSSDEQLRIRVRDDVSAIVEWKAMAQGRILAAKST